MAVGDHTLGQRLALVLRAAITGFAVTASDLRRLMARARDEERSRRRPDDLMELADELSWRRGSSSVVKRIEKAADEVFADILGYLESASGSDAVGARTPARYPVALEQFVALMAMHMPPEQLEDASRRLTEAGKGDPDTMRYALGYLQWRYSLSPTVRFASAVLPTVVAAFEERLGAIFRLRLTLHPDEVADRAIKIATLDRYGTTDDLKRRAIDEKVRTLLAKGPSGWKERVRSDTHVDLATTGLDWGRIVEVVARRHVLVHASGRIDERYLLSTATNQGRLGEALVCDESYFNSALDLLSEALQLVAIAYLANLTRVEPAPTELASTLLLDYLKQRRWADALRLASMVLDGRDTESIPPEVRVNWWMARRESGEGAEGIRSEVTSWDPPASTPRYRVAKAALLFDDNGVRRVLQEEGARSNPLGTTVADWPLIVSMCDRQPSLRRLLQPPRQNRSQRRKR